MLNMLPELKITAISVFQSDRHRERSLEIDSKKSPEEQARAGSAQANLDSLERQIQYALRAAFVAF